MIAIISHSDCMLHDMGVDHPECPERLQVIDNAIKKSDLLGHINFYKAPLATREQLLSVHTPEYIDRLYALSPQTGTVTLDPDTAMNPYTLQAALRSAGASVKAVDLVMNNRVNAAFCSIRPPGHHAESDQAMGFCFFNNIAVGVMHALNSYSVKKVAIVDFDVHHGNGTENMLRDDDRILLCSTFQYPFYPFPDLFASRPGIIKIPLNAGTDSTEYRRLVEQYCLSTLRKFSPDFIFFSAGFDAHKEDPLSNINLVTEDYAWLTTEVKKIADKYCGGRIVSTLEGGYALHMLGECVVAHLSGLL